MSQLSGEFLNRELLSRELLSRELLSRELLRVTDAAEARLRGVTEMESREPVLSGGWSRKQVIGHLIDSASNNHQRFVRAMLASALEFPGYDQAGNVRVQAVQEATGSCWFRFGAATTGIWPT